MPSSASSFGYSPFNPYRHGKEKQQDGSAAVQVLRGGQHFRVYGGNVHQRQFQHIPKIVPRTEQGRTEGFHGFPSQRGRADLLERDTETDNLKTTAT